MRDDECNILQNLSREEFREFRTLVIDMVLATDMSFHFQQLKNMKNLLTLAEPRFLLCILLVVVTYFTPRKEIWYPVYQKLGGPHGQSGQMHNSSPHWDSITRPPSL
jgi:hypothetical protein